MPRPNPATPDRALTIVNIGLCVFVFDDCMARFSRRYGDSITDAIVSFRYVNAIYFGFGCISQMIPLQLLFVRFGERLHQRWRDFQHDERMKIE